MTLFLQSPGRSRDKTYSLPCRAFWARGRSWRLLSLKDSSATVMAWSMWWRKARARRGQPTWRPSTSSRWTLCSLILHMQSKSEASSPILKRSLRWSRSCSFYEAAINFAKEASTFDNTKLCTKAMELYDTFIRRGTDQEVTFGPLCFRFFRFVCIFGFRAALAIRRVCTFYPLASSKSEDRSSQTPIYGQT